MRLEIFQIRGDNHSKKGKAYHHVLGVLILISVFLENQNICMAPLDNQQGGQRSQGGMIMKVRILAILPFIGLALFFSGCDGSDSTSTSESEGDYPVIIPLEYFDPATINTANWMSKLFDVTPLNQIVFPGSHDAGMSKADNCNPNIVKTEKMTKTQKWNIGQQLIAGSRYFDIRLKYAAGSELMTYHRTEGKGCDGEVFRDIMKATGEFLMTYPTEFAIFKFSKFYHHGTHDAQSARDQLCLAMQAWDDYFKMPEHGGREIFYKRGCTMHDNLFHFLRVSDLRGKILAVFDPDSGSIIDPTKGRFSYWDVGNGGAWWLMNFPVYDEYSNTSDYFVMAVDQLKKYKIYGGFFKLHLFLLSWTLTPGVVTWNDDIENLAKKANGHLPFVMRRDIWGKHPEKFFPNIVYIDFVDIGINQHIIQYNPAVRTVWFQSLSAVNN